MNRALEFLNEAYGLIPYPSNGQTAQTLVRLAVDEVTELLQENYELRQRLAALEARSRAALPKPNGDGGPVLIENAQPLIPARLAESQCMAKMLEWFTRKALPNKMVRLSVVGDDE